MGDVGGPERSSTSDPAVMEYLSQVELLDGLQVESLEQLLAASREAELAAGDWLIRQGESGDEMYVILRGEFEVSLREGSVEEPVARRSRGDVVGEMALLGHVARSASVRALTAGRVLVVSRAAFEQLLASPGAATTIYRTSLTREHNLAALLARREKLAALGTMAAGLAHELNNPAAALRRSAQELGPAHERRDRSAVALFGQPLGAEERRRALELGALAAERFARTRPGGGDPEQEEELLARLEGYGVPDAWEDAAALADAGWTAPELEEAVAPFGPAARAVVAAWLGADAACRLLLREIALSSEAVSALVGAVKEYSHLDRAPVAEVDVHASLENTLLILAHRLKQGGVTVVRRYGENVPRIEAFASELNQVWTNLIDNAVDAMAGGGVLTLATHADDAQVTVEVTDDGPGVPEAERSRLFEPFRSTKGVGEGTGLGLYIAKEIVAKRHGGSLGFSSAPGATTFRVTLPLRLTPHA